jgi:hypothetical protein
MSWTNTDIKRIVGKWYDRQPEQRSEDISKNYNQIATINEAWFDLIPIEVVFQSDDPYDSYIDMKETVEREGKLRVFNGGSEPKFMSKEQNIKGRAVHDYFGHLSADCNFSMRGELQKWNHVKDHYPKEAHSLLFTEIVGQRGAVSYYDGFGDPRFTQKAVKAPTWLIDLVREFYGV